MPTVLKQSDAKLRQGGRFTRNAHAILIANNRTNLVTGRPLTPSRAQDFPKNSTRGGIATSFRSNGIIQTETLPALGTSPFVEFWYGVPIAFNGNADSAANGDAGFVTGSGNNQTGICVNRRNYATDWGAVYQWANLNGTNDVLTLGKLVLLLIVRRSDRMEFWRDGNLVATVMQSPISYPASTLNIGGFINTGFWYNSNDTIAAGRIQANWSHSDVRAFSADPIGSLIEQPETPLFLFAQQNNSLLKDLSSSYSINGSVGKSLSANYTVFNSVAKSLSANYGIYNYVAKSLAASYGVFNGVEKSLSANYNINNSVARNLVANYFVTGSVSKQLAGNYAILGSVGKSFSATYGVNNYLSKNLAASYGINNYVAKSLVASYGIYGKVERDLTVSYTINSSTSISKQLTASYGISNYLAKSLAASYSISNSVSKSLTGSYEISSYVARSLNVNYNVGNSIGKSLSASYGINNYVIKSLNASYSVNGKLTKDLSALYAINSSTTISKQLVASYGIAGSVSKNIAAAYAILGSVGKSFATAYEIRNAVSKSLTGAYGITGVVQKSLSASYNIQGTLRLIKSLSALYSIRGPVVLSVGNVYRRQIENAKRQIAAKGQIIEWKQSRMVLIDGGLPYKPKREQKLETSYYPRIVFLPISREKMQTLMAVNEASEISSGAFMGLMAAVEFEPSDKDIVIRNGVQLDIHSIDTLAPNGEKILHTIIFKG